MRIIRFILKKEFLQIFRNKAMIPIIFFMPLVQLLILSNAATYEIKNIKFSVVDFDQSKFSRELISKFTSTGYFILTENSFSVSEAEEGFKKNTTKMVLNIPKNFEKDYRKNGTAKIQAIINAEDGSAAGIINNYTMNIVQQFAGGVKTEWSEITTSENSPMININYSNWFNPELDYKTYMVPGILVALVSMIGMFLTGMNIVKEKEIGTIEQLNVTPIKKMHFIIGKLLPFWIIGLFELAFGTTLGMIIFNIPMLGSPFLILLVAAIYLLVILGMGLFISTFTNTQQQAMFIAWFFLVIFMLMGGIFTPVESMPDWAQTVTFFNPISHFSRTLRMIMLKGSGFYDVLNTIYVLAGYAAVMLTFAIFRYKKVEG
jgi:ABC-2 type transport system permease protein